MGAYLTAEETTSVVMDPEAALVATCGLGRTDPRLFDEVLDWLALNHRLIRPDRVRSLLKDRAERSARVLAALAAFTREAVGEVFLPGLIKEERAKLAGLEDREVEDLFTNGRLTPGSSGRELDRTFLEWGFRRSEVALRRLSRSPNPNNPANIMLLMRAHYGKSARAEILTYLLTGQPGSSYQIARMIGYNQSTVIRALEAMSRGGPVITEGEGKAKRFMVDRNSLAQALWFPGPESMPVFLNWGYIFRAFEDSVTVCRDIETGEFAEVLKVEVLLDLSERMTHLFRNAGEPLQGLAAPDPERLRQPGGEGEIGAFAGRVQGVILKALSGNHLT